MVEQLRHEHDAKIADLKGALAMIAKLMEFENRLSDKVVTFGQGLPIHVSGKARPTHVECR